MRKSDVRNGTSYAVWHGWGGFDPADLTESRYGTSPSDMRKFTVTDKTAKKPRVISEYSNETVDRPAIVGESTRYDDEGNVTEPTHSAFYRDASKFVMLWEEWEKMVAPVRENLLKEKRAEEERQARIKRINDIFELLGCLVDREEKYYNKLEVDIAKKRGRYEYNKINIQDRLYDPDETEEEEEPAFENIPVVIAALEDALRYRGIDVPK